MRKTDMYEMEERSLEIPKMTTSAARSGLPIAM